jgi:hypothetical protein
MPFRAKISVSTDNHERKDKKEKKEKSSKHETWVKMKAQRKTFRRITSCYYHPRTTTTARGFLSLWSPSSGKAAVRPAFRFLLTAYISTIAEVPRHNVTKHSKTN